MSLKATIKSLVKRALVGSGVLRLAGRSVRPGTAILMYHSVQDQPDRYANSIGLGLIHATSVFERHMEVIARRFNPVTLDDILLFVKGEKPSPPRSVSVTFDDGYSDNFHVAAPLLSRFGIRATFYVTVNLIGTKNLPWFSRLRHGFATTPKKEWLNPASGQVLKLLSPADRNAAFVSACELCARTTDGTQEKAVNCIERDLDVESPALENGLMMTWDQVMALHRAGHIIGSHTLTHPNLAHVADADLRREVVESKGRLETLLGAPAVHFSYPHPALNPQWNETTSAAVHEAGYRTAVTTASGLVRTGDYPLTLSRIWVARPEREFLWNLECTFLGRRV